MFEKQTALLKKFSQLVDQEPHVNTEVTPDQHLRVGVDLGTSTIVFVVLNENNVPIYGESIRDHAVRDGIVVNYREAVDIVTHMRERAQSQLNVTLKSAAGAIPPGVSAANSKAVANVIEDSGMHCSDVVDEPTAAATMLGITDGTIVDVGGGTTGISLFQDGHLLRVGDEPTGGYHMTLVLAGNRQLDHDAAEQLKRDPTQQNDVFMVVKPVVENMAHITDRVTNHHLVQPVVVVGGATNFDAFASTFSKQLGVPVMGMPNPDFVTPIGIAMSDKGAASDG